MMYQHFKPLTKIYKEVYKHCFFKLENSEKTVVFSMDATFDSDFLNIFTSFHIFKRGKRKMGPF